MQNHEVRETSFIRLLSQTLLFMQSNSTTTEFIID